MGGLRQALAERKYVSLTTVEERKPEGELSLVNKRVGVMEDLYGIRVINHHPL